MIPFNHNDSLINRDLLTPTGDFNFTFKVSIFHVLYIKTLFLHLYLQVKRIQALH